jgi:tetratricopeptide (TPR) repeat protein
MHTLVRPSSRALLALVLMLGAAAPARAQETLSAKEHYQKGTSYYDLGRYVDAIKEFEAAYQIKNDPALLYNLAQSHRLAGNSEQALHFYRTYLRYVPKPPNRAEIESRITQLEQVVAQKTASQTAPPKDTLPPTGTTPPATTEPPLTTTPPTTTAPPPGAPPATTTPDTFNSGGGPSAPTSSRDGSRDAPRDPSVGRALRIAGIAGMATGGLCIIIGAIEGGRAVGAANDINNAGAMGGTFDPAVETRGKNAVAAEKGFLVTGFLVGGAGGILYYLGHRQQQESSVAVTPVASASAAGATLRVSF